MARLVPRARVLLPPEQDGRVRALSLSRPIPRAWAEPGHSSSFFANLSDRFLSSTSVPTEGFWKIAPRNSWSVTFFHHSGTAFFKATIPWRSQAWIYPALKRHEKLPEAQGSHCRILSQVLMGHMPPCSCLLNPVCSFNTIYPSPKENRPSWMVRLKPELRYVYINFHWWNTDLRLSSFI